jgi:nifR3 family TIM-barrel protein
MSAPIDGVTDSPFRQLIREFSPKELLFKPMSHVATVANEKTNFSLKYNAIELPLIFQVSLSSCEFIQKAIGKIISYGFTGININAGCPAKLVVRSGGGSALMANPTLLKEIIQIFYNHTQNKINLSLKIRAGFKEKNALDISLMAQDLGINLLIIHPRIQPEGFSGRLDYALVTQIKKVLKIPVIFSGNIVTHTHAQKVYELTGVDGVMIGRGLYGTPWKLKEISLGMQGENFQVSHTELFTIINRHLDLNKNFYGQSGFIHFKKHLAHYIRHIPNAAHWRATLLRSKTEQEMCNHLETLRKIVTGAQ